MVPVDGGARPPSGNGRASTVSEIILTVDDVVKDFPGLRALDHVSLHIRAGEIVALLGKNGSGKSTLVKILAHIYEADQGAVRPRPPAGPGIDATVPDTVMHFVHQDLGLVPTLSIVENIALGRRSTGLSALNPLHRRVETHYAETLIAKFGVQLDVRRQVSTLTPAERSIVAIARAMDGWGPGSNILILDEPTAALHGEEVKTLFQAVRVVAAAGAGVIFISHRLEEVTGLADRVLVLRDGRLVSDTAGAGLTSGRLASLITGATAQIDGSRTRRAFRRPSAGIGSQPLLQVRNLRGRDVEDLDLDVWPGEILGVAGSFGSGRERLAELLYGSLRRDSGSVLLAGELLPANPHRSVRRGMALIPADRRTHGGVFDHSVRENLTLPDLRKIYLRGAVLRRSHERAEVLAWCRRVELEPLAPEQPLRLFSGGNQQKVLVARWLRIAPRFLLIEEPTQGVDVAASESVRNLILDAAAQGVGVLICSSDNTDFIQMCSRVLVMRDARVAEELAGDEINEHRLTQACLGADASAM